VLLAVYYIRLAFIKINKKVKITNMGIFFKWLSLLREKIKLKHLLRSLACL